MIPITERMAQLAEEDGVSPEEVVAYALERNDLLNTQFLILRGALAFYAEEMNYIVQKYCEVEVRDDSGEAARDAVKLIDHLERDYYIKPMVAIGAWTSK